MPKKIANAKIACLDFSLQKAKMHLGVQVLIEDPEKLDAIRTRYKSQTNTMNLCVQTEALFGDATCL